MTYKSISLRKIYITAIYLCVGYIIFSMLLIVFSGSGFNLVTTPEFRDSHPEAIISTGNKLLLLAAKLVWLPFLFYIIRCIDVAYSAKCCKRTFKAAPLLWLLAFCGEHTLTQLILHFMDKKYLYEGWLIQKTEYFTFLLDVLNISALVLVCVSAALGIDEERHFNHMK